MVYQTHQQGEVIYVFNKHLVRSYHRPRIVPGARDTEVKKSEVILTRVELGIWKQGR